MMRVPMEPRSFPKMARAIIPVKDYDIFFMMYLVYSTLPKVSPAM